MSTLAIAGVSSACPRIAVLIATRDRPDLLGVRALPSVIAQTHKPDLLVVVDDSDDARVRERNRRIVDGCGIGAPVYLRNVRTTGAAGAWSTGIDQIRRRVGPPDRWYLAVLDDDDSWEPVHLATCLAAAVAGDLDMVAAGLVRHDVADGAGRPQTIPERLTADDFLVGNPHIQGSNLFVRLDVLLQAGMFDEGLPSCTDRDLCIRIADLGDVRFGSTGRHTVHHHADPGRERLSMPGSPTKRAGLDALWRKWRSRMSPEQQKRFCERGALFDWTPPPPAALPPEPVEEPLARLATDESLGLVVGIIADNERTEGLDGLLHDLEGLSQDPRLSALDVILLENGPRGCKRRLDALARRRRAGGLRVYVVDLERQATDAAAGLFGVPFRREPDRAGIGLARTMLQSHVYLFGRDHRGVVAWILDDDMRLDNLVWRGGDRLERVKIDLVPRLIRLRQGGARIVFGGYTDAPPLPHASTLRTQMVDLLHNLDWLGSLDPSAPLPSRLAENLEARRDRRDYYYDLARRETDRLETPFWLLPERPGETVREAFLRLAKRLPRILAGEAVFRPLFVEWPSGIETRPSVNRGGNTFVFDFDALQDVPNTVPKVNGRETRRSDMIWTILNEYCFERPALEAPLPVRQDRTLASEDGVDTERLVADVQGYALYSALLDVLKLRKGERGGRGPDDLALNERDVAFLERRFQKYLDERLAALELAFYRTCGAARTARSKLDLERPGQGWWGSGSEAREAVAAIRAFCERIERECSAERAASVVALARALEPAQVRGFVQALPAHLDSHRRALERADVSASRLAEQRIEIAQAVVARVCGTERPLRPIGRGAEGVVLTDGERVYKSIDSWKSRAPLLQQEFLYRLVGRWSGTRGLYPLLEVRREGVHTVIVYPFEESTAYSGGHGADLVTLLRECRDAGIACRNIHPDNLRVTTTGLRLVDYGSDIHPYSEDEFEQMCRRAWLTWRWHHRHDLKDLMRRALRDDSLPELDGLERFRRAVDGTPLRSLDDLVLSHVMALRPKTAADFGCGRAQLARRLAASGVETVGFDSDASLAVRWAADGTTAGLSLTCERDGLLLQGPFDVVLSILVLCTIEDDRDYRNALSALRALVRENGRAFVAICNPFFTRGGDTPLQRRFVPPGVGDEDSFVWEKEVRGGGRRRDVHRPFERLRADLLRAGFAIERVLETETVDLVRFEPASDFMVLVLKPVPTAAPRVSLMIKTCIMEHRTIQRQVEHLVRQLETPRAFHERVLVVDSRHDGFSRAYDEPDAAKHAEAVDRLCRRGLVDRVVEGPTAPEVIVELNRRWFGLAVGETHAANGGQVASTLAGFETCASEYVLQVDADVMVARGDPLYDYLEDMIRVLESDPSALTVAMNVPHEADRAYTSAGPDGPWRVEVRVALFHRGRMLAARPFPNRLEDGRLELSWHRSVDKTVREGAGSSWRGGDRRAVFIHPPNDRKRDREAWLAVLDRVEHAFVPADQLGRVDLVGDLESWLGPKRGERFVFVIVGRNVPAGRLRRCIDSVLRQGTKDWGAIAIDDASDPGYGEAFEHVCKRLGDRATVLRAPARRGQLANMVWAIRHVCVDPESVIVTLDADDALIGPGVLTRIALEYDRGADVTVGGMLRTDKHVRYPVDFSDPRRHRGGNVWQHLRSFKKHLFDAIPDEYLRLDGRYVDLAQDWAYMVPVAEMAQRPVAIDEPLYLYEPSGAGKGADREQRERIIGRLLARPSRTALVLRGGR